MNVSDKASPVPDDWLESDKIWKPVLLNTDLYRLMVMHKALVLAHKLPEVGEFHREQMEDIMDDLEDKAKELGLEEPETGWRGLGKED